MSSVYASVALTPGATTQQGVTKINVIGADGEAFYTTTVDGGETSVSLPVPANQRVQLVAVNTVNGTTVATKNITVGGTTYP